jgi:hypothetical protein
MANSTETHCQYGQRNLWTFPPTAYGQGFVYIFGIFHLIFKVKRLENPTGNHLVLTESKVKILWDWLKFMTCDWLGIVPDREWKYIFAKKGFVISEGCSRTDYFPGTIVYYFEVTQSASKWSVK